MEMIRKSWIEEARATVLAFALYLRPSEVLRLTIRSLVAPASSDLIDKGRWSVLLHPFEDGVSSKTRAFDESMFADSPAFPFLPQLMQCLASRKGDPGVTPVFGTAYRLWTSRFQESVATARLEAAGPWVLYQLRHGGASHELAVQARRLDEIKKRGRWLTDTSLRRYEKGARLPELLAKIPRDRQLEAVAATSRIGKLLTCGSRELPLAKRR